MQLGTGSLGVDGFGGNTQGGDLMALELVNLAKTTLNGGINASVTSLDVLDASDFPTDGVFWIGVGEGAVPGFPAELMKVTGVSSNTFTVERGVSPTTAAVHSGGAEVAYTLTAESFTQLRADISRQGTYAEMAALTDMKSGDVFYFDGTDTPYTSAVCNGPSWDLYFRGYKCNPFVLGDYTWDNQGSATATALGGALHLRFEGAISLRVLYKTAPSTPYTVTMLHQFFYMGPEADVGLGCLFRQSSDAKLSIMRYNTTTIQQQKWNTATSFSANYVSTTPLARLTHIWLRITDNGTNRISEFSLNGSVWTTYHTVGRTDFLTADQIGLGFLCNGTTAPDADWVILSWKQT